ncbi:Cell wall-associated hydrolase, NlpC family [Amycolatopsis sacchari]|uniref:Cell wall-associated hydrolase, NlpC family n=1 Tax=Amycolatopsis sacchari TaxID=115433 RepID=A0A1I3Y2G9_9PSEU|nr:C40 family peptidase [Amycolatopsis sacchari]SFK25456.1 Cell wall-associated hydrolase, NlpC family [Amycolatopsis sacchari]
MRIGLLVGVVVAALFAAVFTTGVVAKVVTDQQAAQAQVRNLSCDAAIGPTDAGDVQTAQGQVDRLTPEQRGIIGQIIAIGKQRGLSPRAWQIAIQAGMTESGMRNLSFGDRDSLGIFQMRPSMGWGTEAQLQDIPYQINKFYDVLLAVPNWDGQRPGDSAQDVERSAFPDRYHRWEPMAARLVQDQGQVADMSGCGQSVGLALPANRAAAAAIAFALGEQGKPYVWGATGPNSYDCSGLMLRAYEAAGITLDRVSRDQYHDGAMLPVRDAQPGDLLFWAYDPANPNTIHHVAMYLGGGKIVEAQQTGVPVHVRSVSFDEDELVPQAVRPGV